MPTQNNAPTARIIPVSEVTKAPRGRKAVVNRDLLALLKQVKQGFAADLSDIFGEVERDDRSRVSQIIRTHWRMCQDTKPSINYTPQGVPQVSHRAK
jgi:hypothetical protein